MKNAEALLDSGDTVAAEKAYQDVTQKDPANAEAYHMLAMIAYSGGHMVEAGERILEAITRNDDDLIGPRREGRFYDGQNHGNVVDTLQELV